MTEIKEKEGWPEPHRRYVVMRNRNWFVGTPCYGMHGPWWVPSTPNGETEPISMDIGDRWQRIEEEPWVTS